MLHAGPAPPRTPTPRASRARETGRRASPALAGRPEVAVLPSGADPSQRPHRVAELLRQYFRIAFLMGRPQDLPGGATQMIIGCALAFVTYVVALLGVHELGRALALVLVDLGCTALALRVALSLTGHPGRFEQAFGGLCGASAFVNAAAVPIYLERSPSAEAPISGTTAFAEFVLLVWSLSLLAHVLRHTFELRLGIGILIAFLYVLLLANVIDALMPPASSLAPPAEPDAISSLVDAPVPPPGVAAALERAAFAPPGRGPALSG